MSKEDKAKLDTIEQGAQVNKVTSVAGRTGEVTLTKTDVGLDQVDNTSDLNKPISTATQEALNNKVDTSTYNSDKSSFALKSELSSLATKEELSLKANKTDLDSILRYKGTVDNYDSLPTEEVSVGDVYSLRDTNGEYVATKASPEPTWEFLGVEVDLSQYSTTVQNDEKYQAKGEYLTIDDKVYVNIFDIFDKLDLENGGTISGEDLQKLKDYTNKNILLYISGDKEDIKFSGNCVYSVSNQNIIITMFMNVAGAYMYILNLFIDGSTGEYVGSNNSSGLTVMDVVSTITTVTNAAQLNGYSKPGNTGNISSNDTINSAIGKLERGLDNKVNTSAIADMETKTNAAATYQPKGNYALKSEIPDDYVLPKATSGALGGIKIGYPESGKYYPVELNGSGQAYVNVPWTDTNTTYSNATTSRAGLMSAADKTLLDRYSSYQTINSLSNIAPTKSVLFLSTGSSQSLSVSSLPANVNAISIFIYNSSSSTITITIPSSSGYVAMNGTSLSISGTSGKDWGEINIAYVNHKYLIRIGGVE